MFRTALLQVSQLEEREVPSAAMFADIFPGVWGSYPLNLTPSGNTLFFSADNGHGYEPYTTDGTPGSARMLKNIKPGLGGSNPSDFYAADGGVVYLTADDGTGRALWRSDGTAAGTAKVPGFPAGDTFGGYWAPYRPQAVGLNGSLYFLTATPGSGDMRLWKTDGATTTLLHDFGSVPATVLTNVDLTGGKVTVTFIPPAWTGNTTTIWVTDGTPAGTRLQQQPLTASDPKYGSVALGTGVEVSPGLFVHPTLVSYATGNTATLWASDGVNPASVRLLAAIPSDGGGFSARVLVPLGGQLYFVVDSPTAANRGLWVTDGTAAGTTHLTLPVDFNFSSIQPFNNRLLLMAFDSQAGRYRFWLTDGTAAGTAEVPLPDAPTNTWLGGSVGRLPAGPGFPNGALLFHLGPDGRPYLSDGTAAGGRYADTTGLPTGYPAAGVTPQVDGAGRPVTASAQAGVYFGGAIYFQSPRIGDDRPELWKWDLGGPTQPPPAGPTVRSVVVNDGSAQRSVVTSLTVVFDRRIAWDEGAISVRDANGRPVPVYPMPAPSAGGGTILQIGFGTSPGASLPDGRYTLRVTAGKVRDAGTGAPRAADYTFTFTRLFGDLNGDGVYDRDARVLVHNSLGLHIGDAGYLAALDVNGDGVIDATDELAVVRNWGKSV